ncbi:TetR/AcrR family transcriptional regulator [Streptomyces sp. LP05-1]|uniref:TetR/AcrR family transcriptional regulator n=1 Tax=Streptomyces pyxinae TaxID=2970734 RepID=A0ABT2CPG3_9ACTN|nr:TetR/AcrR family transcriptional regulator [Streptomyces sp. LP05-1]MCS0639320.1 TetR/AcrR family transcriptional regulator [Streptomyces sp. LP05-1]
MTPPRSRLTPERESELYGAVLDLLREVGYDALTMDAVATRTRASKATLYRQWGSKPELVAHALRHDKPLHMGDIDTGTLRGDFHAMVELSDDSRMERDCALMRGLAHAVHDNPDLLTAFRELLVEPEVTGLHGVLTRAVARGEVAADNPALKFVPHMLVGAFTALPLIEGRDVDRAFLAEYVDAVVLPALGV